MYTTLSEAWLFVVRCVGLEVYSPCIMESLHRTGTSEWYSKHLGCVMHIWKLGEGGCTVSSPVTCARDQAARSMLQAGLHTRIVADPSASVLQSRKDDCPGGAGKCSHQRACVAV